MLISKFSNVLALLFFLLGMALIARGFRAERWETPRYMRAATGSFAMAVGNMLMIKLPTYGLIFFLAGVYLILKARR